MADPTSERKKCQPGLCCHHTERSREQGGDNSSRQFTESCLAHLDGSLHLHGTAAALPAGTRGVAPCSLSQSWGQHRESLSPPQTAPVPWQHEQQMKSKIKWTWSRICHFYNLLFFKWLWEFFAIFGASSVSNLLDSEIGACLYVTFHRQIPR